MWRFLIALFLKNQVNRRGKVQRGGGCPRLGV